MPREVPPGRVSGILAMRDIGATLSKIGDHYGISKERVRQILVDRRGTTEIKNLVEISKIASLVPCSRGAVKRRLLKNRIPLLVKGRSLAIRSDMVKEVVALFKGFRTLRCRVCGGQVATGRRFYCSEECRQWWRARTLASKASVTAAVKRWRRKNPGKWRKYQLRWQKKHRAALSKRRYETVKYVLTRDYGDLKKGAEVRVPPGKPEPGFLVVEYGGQQVEVPLRIVRRK